jgi:hypothetical protein
MLAEPRVVPSPTDGESAASYSPLGFHLLTTAIATSNFAAIYSEPLFLGAVFIGRGRLIVLVPGRQGSLGFRDRQ